MKHNEMQKINTLAVFDSVLKGNDTIEKIVSDTDIGHATVETICGKLVNKGLFSYSREKKDSPGRRLVRYSIRKKHYCVYIKEEFDCYSMITINADNIAIDRTVLARSSISREHLSLLYSYIKSHALFDRYCRAIYIECSDKVAAILPKEYTRIKRNDFIINAMKTDNEIILFEIGSKCVLSLYGKIVPTSASRKEIEHVLKIDRAIRLVRTNWDDVFYALSVSAIQEMRKLISK